MTAGNEQQTKAIAELNRLAPDERLAALELLITKRRNKSYVKYFEPWSEQRTALASFTSDVKVMALLGGNRSGKTVLGAFLAVAWALGKKYFEDELAYEYIKDLPIPEGPKNIWVVGLDFSVLRDVIWYEKLVHGKNQPPFLPDDGSIRKKSDSDFQVFLENGSIITGKSADSGAAKFQGSSVDFIWIDEECEKDVFDECYQRTADCSGVILLTLTPVNDINSGVRAPWVFDLHESWLAGDTSLQFSFLSTVNSPFIPAREKAMLLAKWAGDPQEEARLYGKFYRKSGLVYNEWNKALHVIAPFEIPRAWQRMVTIDPAATGVTAALWLAINDKGDMFGYREYYEKDLVVSDHAKNIRLQCADDPIDIWLLDPTWGRQRNAETHKTGAQLWRDNGIPVRLPDVGEDFGLAVSREYLKAAVVPNSRHPKFQLLADSCPNFEFEISRYTWDTFGRGERTGQSKDKPRKGHDHLLNAWQYGCSVKPRGRREKVRQGDDFFADNDPKVNLASYT